MDRRSLAIVTAFLLVVGPPFVVAEVVHIPAEVSQGVSPVVYVLGIGLAAAAVVAAVVMIAHQYVRWEKHRPAIHLVVVTLLFVYGVALWLGPVGIGSAEEPLTTQERHAIAAAGLVLSLYLLLFLVNRFDDADRPEGRDSRLRK